MATIEDHKHHQRAVQGQRRAGYTDAQVSALVTCADQGGHPSTGPPAAGVKAPPASPAGGPAPECSWPWPPIPSGAKPGRAQRPRRRAPGRRADRRRIVRCRRGVGARRADRVPGADAGGLVRRPGGRRDQPGSRRVRHRPATPAPTSTETSRLTMTGTVTGGWYQGLWRAAGEGEALEW
jgi:hypothetical protein